MSVAANGGALAVAGRPTAQQISAAIRSLAVLAVVIGALAAVSARLVVLALAGRTDARITLAEPIATSYARPDIVDAMGRLIATDIALHAVIADPSKVLDADVAAEQLARVLPGLDAGQLRAVLADRSRQFAWVRRGLSPALAATVHELGLPGISLKLEPRRSYPMAELAGWVLGSVDLDNKGVTGLEAWIDAEIGIDAVHAPRPSLRRPVRLSLDIAVQHALEAELAAAMTRYKAPAASGVLMDAESGELVAAASLPSIDPAFPERAANGGIRDRLIGSSYELGSIMKAFTVAMALDEGLAAPTRRFETATPLDLGGGITITDHPPFAGGQTAADIFVRSSNVGAGLIALEAGPERQRAFLARLGLTGQLRTEAGPTAAAREPRAWGRAETVTVAYGHGLAVSPLQVTAAAAALVNGGLAVTPTFISGRALPDVARKRVVAPSTSAEMVRMFRRNVADPAGTGAKAEAAGYYVGGKTGTADRAVAGGYAERSVVASFLAAFPMNRPRYVLLVTLHEPEATAASAGARTAANNAAPTAAAIVRRVAPLVGVLPGS